MSPKSNRNKRVDLREPDGSNIRPMTTFRRYTGTPNLIRTSSLDPLYVHQNLNNVNTPVKLIFKNDLLSMNEDWSDEEIETQRRLVRFKFSRVSINEFFVEFEAIRKDQYDHTSPIISCIYWKEKDINIVTSVDVILILEYLVQESFTIEEKNRIRRNLQSLKPYTISRSNKQFERFFKLLMSMEDPRPRNIEQDLKVFKWNDLFKAINKVISKYSVVDSYPESARPPAKHATKKLPEPKPTGEKQSGVKQEPSQYYPGFSSATPFPQPSLPPQYGSATPPANFPLAVTPGAAPVPVQSPYGGAHDHPGGAANPAGGATSDRSGADSRAPHYPTRDQNGLGAKNDQSYEVPADGGPEGASQVVFMPSERLKVLKRRINKNGSAAISQNPSGASLPAPAHRNNLFQHALKPSDPVPMNLPSKTDTKTGSSDDADTEKALGDTDDSPDSVESPTEAEPAKQFSEPNERPSLDGKSDDMTISGPSEGSDSPESGSNSNSHSNRSNSNSNTTNTNSNAHSSTSLDAGSNSNPSQGSNGSTSHSGLSSANVFSNNSARATSLNTSGESSVGTFKPKSRKAPGLDTISSKIENLPQKTKSSSKKKLNEKNQNIKMFAEDQSRRMFGEHPYEMDQKHERDKLPQGAGDALPIDEEPKQETLKLQYYQYPTQSMLYSSNPNPKFTDWNSSNSTPPPAMPPISSVTPQANSLSTSNMKKHDREQVELRQKPDTQLPSIGSHHPFGHNNVTLSSIGESLSNTDETSTKLPPIIRGNESINSSVKLAMPSLLTDLWNSSTRRSTSDPHDHRLSSVNYNLKREHERSPPDIGKMQNLVRTNSSQPPQKVQATSTQKDSQSQAILLNNQGASPISLNHMRNKLGK